MRCAPVSPWSRSRSSCATPPPAATWPASCTAAARPGRSRASLAAAASGAVATEVEVPEMHTWPLVAALVGLLVGSAVGRWSAPQLLEALAATNLSRVNYRQRTVVAGLGIALAIGLLVWAGPLALVGELGSGSGWPARSGIAMSGAAVAAVLAGLGFTLLGLLDDLIQDQGHRGFRGHVQALARGRLTGGAVKLLGGALVALVVAPLAVGLERPWYLMLVGAVVIASSANLANLLDLRERGMLGDAGANALGAVVGVL